MVRARSTRGCRAAAGAALALGIVAAGGGAAGGCNPAVSGLADDGGLDVLVDSSDATMDDVGVADVGSMPDAACGAQRTSCSGACVDLFGDPMHCGDCATACRADQVCARGACASACPAGFVECGGACVDPSSNNAHCGATDGCGADGGSAGVACPPGNLCSSGMCETTCQVGLVDCAGTCVNPGTDPQHCGAADGCGVGGVGSAGSRCAPGEVCNLGACSLSCQAGLVNCAGTCVDGATSNRFCGATPGCGASGMGSPGTSCLAGHVCVAGACSLTCQAGLVNCDGTCIDPQSDRAHCGATGACGAGASGSPGAVCSSGQVCSGGACQVSCPAGEVNCGGTCVDPALSNQHCGATGQCGTGGVGGAGAACAAGSVCSGGVCQVSCQLAQVDCYGTCIDPRSNPTYCGATGQCGAGGVGRAGTRCGSGQACVAGGCVAVGNQLTVSAGTTTINVVATTASASGGSSSIAVGSSSGFVMGALVLVHQSQGAGAGAWEVATVASVPDDVTLTTAAPLAHTYTTPGAQVVLVPEYQDVDVASGATLTAPPWNGSTGGILAFRADGTTTIAGTVTMTGKGFRGPNHSQACGTHCAMGQQGESSLGVGIGWPINNGGGGGGGAAGQDCGMGAGGGYGGGGGGGVNNAMDACTMAGDSAGGDTAGGSDLAQAILFGGAGGEGGYDDDGAWAGPGGSGGGIVVMLTNQLTVTGAVTSNGAAGGDGDSTSCGSGCGMGGGGGGAGGAIRIVATTAALGDGLVGAGGASGGACSCAAFTNSGAGGAGRIAVQAGTISGTTVPVYFGG